MHIGGIDNAVVRNPLTQRPYIPGSSIKGKIRSLLEWRSGAVRSAPLGWSDFINAGESESVLMILKLFGVAGSDQLTNEQAARIGPARLSFWDNPRYTERVVAGTAFDFRLSLKVLDCDGEDMRKTVLAGLRLLEFDSLGGSGSRGYGKVKFENVTIDGKDCQAEFDQIDPFKL